MNVKSLFPKFIYWGKATWARSQWLCYDYMKLFLKYKDNNEYSAKRTYKSELKDVIWIYWRQGEENAPAIVRKCINSVRRNAGNHHVIVLNERTMADYLVMPDFIEKKHQNGKIKEALYSDLLRISLLLEYGGIWCDATCYMTEKIYPIIEGASFFMFNKSLLYANTIPSECSSWFIKAGKGNIALQKIRNILFHYYHNHSWLPDYYIFHVTHGLLVHTDKEVRRLWESKPYICNMNPHVFLFSFSEPYNEKMYRHILNSCFIHKLTYKYDPKLLEAEHENMLNHFMRTE